MLVPPFELLLDEELELLLDDEVELDEVLLLLKPPVLDELLEFEELLLDEDEELELLPVPPLLTVQLGAAKVPS